MVSVNDGGMNFVSNQLYLWRDRLNHRATAIGSLAIALGCFCGAAGVKLPLHKFLLMSSAVAASSVSLRSSKAHRFADVMVHSLERASLGGWQQQATQALMPTTKRGDEPVQMEAEILEDNEEIDPFLLKMAEMDNPVAKQICGALAQLGVLCYCDRIEEGLAFNRYYLIPDGGVKAAMVADKSKDLMVKAGFSQEPSITVVGGAIAVDVARRDRQFAKYADFVTSEVLPGCHVPIGVNQLDGKMVYSNFADSNSCHQMVAGMTGSGKSEMLATQIQYVLDHYPDVKLLLVDVKMSTFGRFKDHPNVTLIENAVHGTIAITEMVAKMQQRREKRSGFKDVDSYNAKADIKIPRVLVYVEELKDTLDGLQFVTPNELKAMSDAMSRAFESEITVGTGKGAISPEKVLMMGLGRIGQAGRSENINLTLITQEPDKKLLDSLIGNLPSVVGLKLRSFVESNVVLPGRDAHCERLLGKGDLMYSVPGQGLQRLQSLFLG